MTWRNRFGCSFAFLVVLGFSSAVFAVNDDSIFSQHVKEADGTSGQNTNAGSGIKTGHIQDGAVTDAKITGPISTSKLNVGIDAGTVAAGNHDHDAVYQKKYAQVITVSTSGGDYTSLYDAMSSITDASVTKQYLIKIMPGIYQLQNPPYNVVCYGYIHIEGSGKNATKLTSQSDGSNASLRPPLSMAGPDCSIRDLTVEVLGNAAENKDAVAFHSHHSPEFSNLAIIATGGSNDAGIKIFEGGPTIKDVTIITNGTGIMTYPPFYNVVGDVNLENVKIGENGSSMISGITSGGKTYRIRNSEINGGILVDYPSGSAAIAHSMVSSTLSGAIKLVNCYNGGFAPIPNQ